MRVDFPIEIVSVCPVGGQPDSTVVGLVTEVVLLGDGLTSEICLFPSPLGVS